MIELYRNIYLVLFGVGAFACWGFVFRYATNFYWYTNVLGRHLMSVSAICGLIYTWNFIVIMFPEWQANPLRIIMSMALFALFTGLLVWRLIIFEKLARDITGGKVKMDNAEVGNDNGDAH